MNKTTKKTWVANASPGSLVASLRLRDGVIRFDHAFPLCIESFRRLLQQVELGALLGVQRRQLLGCKRRTPLAGTLGTHLLKIWTQQRMQATKRKPEERTNNEHTDDGANQKNKVPDCCP